MGVDPSRSSDRSGQAPTVVIAIRTLAIGGAERLATEEALQLHRSGTAVEVWFQIDGPFREELELAGVTVNHVATGAARGFVSAAAERCTGTLVIHTHSPSFGAWLRLISIGVRDVAFVHTEHNVASGYGRVTKLLHHATSRRIDQLVAVSDAVLQTAPPTRDRMVLHHVDVSSPRMQQCLSAPPKQSGPLRLGCIASLTEKKDHANLFAALHLLDAHIAEPVAVAIVGTGPLRSSVERLTAELTRDAERINVEVCGHRDDIPSILEGLDILVLPSSSEGLPLILVESLAASTPVVATDVGGVAELVEDGVTGLLVSARDPEALAGRLALLLGDSGLRSRLASAGRLRVLSEAGSPWIESYQNIIERLATR